MDTDQDQDHHHHHHRASSTPQPPSQPSPQFAVYTYPKHRTKKRRAHIIKIKRTQIHADSSPQPNSNSNTQLVLDDKLGKSTSNKQKKAVVNDFYNDTETSVSTMERAKELQATLDASLPSFAKVLVRSNVTVGFWMHLPMPFCKLHLPKSDAAVSVEMENGREFTINYIADRTALSGGWKAFCSANQLHEGDILVFHLLKPVTFKVYIVRGSRSTKVNGEFGKETTPEKQIKSDHAEEDKESGEKAKRLELPDEVLRQNEKEERSLMVLDEGHGAVRPENGFEGHRDSKMLDVIVSSGSAVDFTDLDSFESFSIVINDLAIDSEISDYHRTTYYELCRSQNSFLHDNLLKSINYKLATEIIIGVVNISEAMRTSKLSSSGPDFSVWDKTLKGFELLGMNVGFLRSRLNLLMRLANEAEETVESESREARQQQVRIVEEMRSLELQLTDLQETRERLDVEIESLKENAESQELKFQEVVNSPW
ncbi:B3 domain-containing protein Os01g0234100-like [Mercurialis annua]|uniref:B3 domain-containing protein Os01g0234100-like n=1 Tax=Mercurialis annua TaxID=3986 RepID=UPI0021607D70|nr:B3 domain-containing protein Os01g0234100-like [Mercurialis annua]